MPRKGLVFRKTARASRLGGGVAGAGGAEGVGTGIGGPRPAVEVVLTTAPQIARQSGRTEPSSRFSCPPPRSVPQESYGVEL